MPRTSKKRGGGETKNGEYVQLLNPQGYINNREITNLPGQFLVKGSQNVMIKNNEKVVQRPGYTRLGAVKTGNTGIHSSYDWNNISSGSKRSSRLYGTSWEVYFEKAWRLVKTMTSNAHMEFSTWWNKNELIDVLLGCNGSGKIYEWSGAITKVAGVTPNTITKQGYINSAIGEISFQNNGAGLPGTIIKFSGGLNNAGFKSGDTITISGSVSNNQTCIIQSVTDSTIVIRPEYTITTEVPAAGPNIIVQWPLGTWGGQRFFSINAGDDTNRKIKIGTIEYTYTGGEATGTLTGVTPDPTIAATAIVSGDVVSQVVRTYTIATGSGQNPATSYAIDLIATVNNLVFYGSLSNRAVYQAKSTDFASCTWTDPLRLPGEGMTILLDSCPTAFIPGQPDNSGQQDNKMYITAGTDDIYRISYKQQTVSSVINEIVTIGKINTTTGSAARSQAAVAFIKSAAVYLSFEPTIDSFAHQSNVVTQTPLAKAISDPIRDDIENYVLTGAHGIYFRRNLYYTLPVENKMIVFDMITENHYWQPPWIVSFSRLAIIEIDGVLRLCAHSSTSNESYTLNDGTNDNGATFLAKAAFGYENFGSRFENKVFDEAAVELYMSESTILYDQILYDYKGGSDSRVFPIDGSDSDLVSGGPPQDVSEGTAPEGTNPEGSAIDELDTLQKLRIIHQTSAIDFFERQRIFYTDSIDAQFAILAYGENVRMSDNINLSIKK